MYVVTNRVIHETASGLDMFGKQPNPSGPNELRLLYVNENDTKKVRLLEDRLSADEVRELAKRFNLDIDADATWFQSLSVACDMFERAQKENKSILLFVHGYNNDIGDIVRAAKDLQDTYNLIVMPFTWPANGGGPVSGTAAYLSDKDDARCSATALHRVVGKLQRYHNMLVEGTRAKLWEAAQHKEPLNHEKARTLFNRLMEKQCTSRISMLCHSMGNYVLKHALLPSNSSLRSLAFDNIALVAADVNNPGHAAWIGELPVRNRLFVVINENDGALKWSRRKPGEEQLARLGHHLKNLSAPNSYYIDVTRNKGVGGEHSYFRSKTVGGNNTLKRLFAQIFNGEDAEKSLNFHADLNVYRS